MREHLIGSMFRAFTLGIALLFLWGCHPEPVRLPSSQHRLVGAIHSSHGLSTSDSILIVTDLTSSKELAVIHVNAAGVFDVEVSANQVALTVTNPHEWSYLPKAAADGHRLNIRLSNECTVLRGQIHVVGTMQSKLEPLRIARIDDEIGDMFAASLDSELRFEACLPDAQYAILLPPQFAARTIVTDLPAQMPLSIDTVTQRDATVSPTEPLTLDFVSRSAFVKQLPDTVRVLGLGESNHGTAEFTRERAELTVALARERAFSMILLEAGFGEVLPANAYIHGTSIDLDFAISRIGFQVLKTQEMRQVLETLRAYNQGLDPAKQISIVGIDIQRSGGALEDLLTPGVDLTHEEAGLLARLRDKDGNDWKKFSQSDRLVTTRVLERIASWRGAGGIAAEVNRHALCARSLRLLLDIVDARTSWDLNRIRDSAMAQISREILELEPGRRATLWAHLDHVSRDHIVGIPPLGSYLSSAIGEHYRAYGLLAYEGAASAKDLEHLQTPPITFPLAAAPAYSVEGVLARSGGGKLPEISYWMFGDRAARSAQWLGGLRWLRAFGYAYPGDERSFELHNLGAIDGVVLFKTVRPTRLLNLPPLPPQPATNPSP